MNNTRVADLTVDELLTLLRGEMHDIVRQAVQEAIETASNQRPDQMAIFDIPPLKLDPHHPSLTIMSREDMYGDDGR